ncbi:MAG: hypothetical protein GXO75_03090, partial [Calditrichaeota bacterium]|nr:hypothetical protein [Calditrichota bacterium]
LLKKTAGLGNLIIIIIMFMGIMGLRITSIIRICYLVFAYIRFLSPYTVESCPENPAHLVREFGFLDGKRFYSVLAQENPHFNDSELREVKKWLNYKGNLFVQ